jgi:hypothetical protein
MTTRPCTACRQAIGFVRMAVGKATPVNPELVRCWVTDELPAPGQEVFRVVLVLDDGRVLRAYRALDAAPGARQVAGYVSHFATCTDAAQFRRPTVGV